MNPNEENKLDLKSLDITEDKIAQLKSLFPEVVTENKIDFEKLEAVLGEEIETGKERYGMNWPGKANCFKIIQEPSIGTLKPVRDDSVDFDKTENLFIEGDSLEVLKLLQKSYYGKIKMIYIDPPYNTGNDFIYPDNYSESLDTYLRYTGQKGENGLKLTTNAETEGRYHSKWINMMFTRLFLARNLLKEEGVVFISIDDHEVDNLKKICNEIFGEENFIALFIWEKKYTSSNNITGVSSVHEYIICYGKNNTHLDQSIKRLEYTDEALARYKNPDDDPRGVWMDVSYHGPKKPSERPNLSYPIIHPKTLAEIYPREKSWAYEKKVHEKHIEENRLWWGESFSYQEPRLKKFLSEIQGGIIPRTLLSNKEVGGTSVGRDELRKLFEDINGAIFDNPKPTTLIKRLIQIVNMETQDIVLDFFSGSSSTADAVLALNQKDNFDRKFIMVQLQEPTLENSEAYKAGYKNIAEIGKERIRRVIEKIKKENSEIAAKLDLGFKVLRLDESNFKIWNKKSDKSLTEQLQLSVNNISDDSSDEDILYEIILKAGYPLTVSIQKLEIQGKIVYSIDDNSLVVCLENDLTQELMKELANLNPARVICLDRGFEGNDELKTNIVELMKAKEVEFKTV